MKINTHHFYQEPGAKHSSTIICERDRLSPLTIVAGCQNFTVDTHHIGMP